MGRWCSLTIWIIWVSPEVRLGWQWLLSFYCQTLLLITRFLPFWRGVTFTSRLQKISCNFILTSWTLKDWTSPSILFSSPSFTYFIHWCKVKDNIVIIQPWPSQQSFVGSVCINDINFVSDLRPPIWIGSTIDQSLSTVAIEPLNNDLFTSQMLYVSGKTKQILTNLCLKGDWLLPYATHIEPLSYWAMQRMIQDFEVPGSVFLSVLLKSRRRHKCSREKVIFLGAQERYSHQDLKLLSPKK